MSKVVYLAEDSSRF